MNHVVSLTDLRYVLFGKSFATAMQTLISAHPKNRWLFQTRRNSRFSTRRVQQIVRKYAEIAGVKATPHTFRLRRSLD